MANFANVEGVPDIICKEDENPPGAAWPARMLIEGAAADGANPREDETNEEGISMVCRTRAKKHVESSPMVDVRRHDIHKIPKGISSAAIFLFLARFLRAFLCANCPTHFLCEFRYRGTSTNLQAKDIHRKSSKNARKEKIMIPFQFLLILLRLATTSY